MAFEEMGLNHMNEIGSFQYCKMIISLYMFA